MFLNDFQEIDRC